LNTQRSKKQLRWRPLSRRQ